MLNPTILWAQDKKSIFLTFEIRNIKEQDIQLLEQNIKIKGRNENNEFDVDIQLFSSIDTEQSTLAIKPKGIIITLKKSVDIFWNKLSTVKMNNLKIDWSKWVNEDDSDLEDDYPFDKNAKEGFNPMKSEESIFKKIFIKSKKFLNNFSYIN